MKTTIKKYEYLLNSIYTEIQKKKILKAICYLTTITTYQPNILFKSYTYNFKLNIINVNHAGFYIYPFKFKQNLTI